MGTVYMAEHTMIGRVVAEGAAVLVSTPYMDEAIRCDRVALIQRGRLLGVDEPGAIARSFEGDVFEVDAPERYRALLAIHSARCRGRPVKPIDRLRKDEPARISMIMQVSRVAASTKAVVSFTSIDGLTRSLFPRSSTPAKFMPIVESPGELV